MASGDTTTSALTDSLPIMIASARQVREMEGVMPALVDKVTLDENTGLTWTEVSYAKLTATAVTETTVLDNPQQLSDTPFSITPTVVGIHTVITDRVARRLSAKAYAKAGGLAQNAIQRKKDIDLLTVLDGATVSQPGAGYTLTSGVISAMVRQITSNATEAGKPPIRCVLHGYQIQDIDAELRAGVGTYNVSDGPTADVLRNGFRGMVGGAEVFEDGNISIDSSTDDCKGGVFTSDAIVLVQGVALKSETKRLPEKGGGATALYIYDEYAAGERSAGNWLKEILSDASAPTS